MKNTKNFWDIPDKSGGPDSCWEWPGKDNGHGYCQFRGRYVHRTAWELTNGPIPEGLTIDHLCRNRRCVNPAHLQVVTQKENNLRGDSPSARRARQTHCKRGHLLAGDNLIVVKDGHRTCRTCYIAYYMSPAQQARRAAYNQKRRAAQPHLTNDGERNGNAKLTVEQVVEIRRLGAEHTKKCYREVGELFGIHPNYVEMIVNGRAWKSVPAQLARRGQEKLDAYVEAHVRGISHREPAAPSTPADQAADARSARETKGGTR